MRRRTCVCVRVFARVSLSLSLAQLSSLHAWRSRNEPFHEGRGLGKTFPSAEIVRSTELSFGIGTSLPTGSSGTSEAPVNFIQGPLLRTLATVLGVDNLNSVVGNGTSV